jgi:hypothetical protein
MIGKPNKQKLYFPKLQNIFITITIRYISLRIISTDKNELINFDSFLSVIRE